VEYTSCPYPYSLSSLKYAIFERQHDSLMEMDPIPFIELQKQLKGALYFDDSPTDQGLLSAYATDASIYQEIPLAVAIPTCKEDLLQLIHFARRHVLTLIPRAAGTSLAGQVVGKGIVVDISKYFNRVLEINTEEGWILVEPGVIRDDLNKVLFPHGVFFGPETSTASRAMIGGMIGNNSSGLHSMVWGDTRSHLLALKVLLDDGTEVEFRALEDQEWRQKCQLNSREGELYRRLDTLLQDPKTASVIDAHFPKKSVKRRNTGYALDCVGNPIQGWNLQRLLAGSEGTLGMVIEAKLAVLPLPLKEVGILCAHFHTLNESFHATLLAQSHAPYAIELVDRTILKYTEGHPTYHSHRFFIEGDPDAILMIELRGDTKVSIENQAAQLVEKLKEVHWGYAFPLIIGPATQEVWEVRKAGLGLIRNLPGEVQAVNLIEDCAVATEDLPAYMSDVQALLQSLNVEACFYAHAGAGEIHVEPFLNLKTQEGTYLFRHILEQCALLVRKYRGSLSGEHGDGRLRGEMIPLVMGDEAYRLFREIKAIFDPQGIFNRGKIVDAPPMDQSLRFTTTPPAKPPATLFDYSSEESMLRLTEKCSGSGDCRKTHFSGGTMCPSFMATRQEVDSTRARANLLRQYWTKGPTQDRNNADAVKSVLDLCLSCKACKTECPSQVDMTKLKAEFLQHYFDTHGVDRRSWWMARFEKIQRMASWWPELYNFGVRNPLLSSWIKDFMKMAPQRSLPLQASQTLRRWARKQEIALTKARKVYLLADEFTNYHDLRIGQTAYHLLQSLGYEVHVLNLPESGRAALSKGLLRHAKRLAHLTLERIQVEIDPHIPVVGIEPAALLTYRDEYPDLVGSEWKEKALLWSKQCLMIEEFIVDQHQKGHISSLSFGTYARKVLLHTHCYQKALGISHLTEQMLQLIPEIQIDHLPTGCCGMAGSFGYEKEHYQVSMQIAELVLLPSIRKEQDNACVAAPGHSCRHQIKDALDTQALHPLEILWIAKNK
jgi:FAD/FMN-containing dehydrogenase/Fe-S oxidoreductase